MEWINDFHFLRPYWLLLLILPFFIYYKFSILSDTQSSWAKVCDKNLLQFLLVKHKGGSFRFSYILAIIISVLIIISLAGPTWIKKQNPTLSIDNPLMILLHNSPGMWVKDVTPSRMVRAKYLIKDILKDADNTETGFIVYTSEPYMITPLVEDDSIIDNLLPAIESNIMPDTGDRLDRAIDLATTRMSEALFKEGNIVILTADVGSRFDSALESTQRAIEKGFTVNVINMSALDNDKLQMIAEKGEGLYLKYDNSLTPLIQEINNITLKEMKQSDNLQVVWEDMGYYLLWIPALLLLYYFRRGILVAFILFMISSNSYANIFLNSNQKAMKDFNNKNYKDASEKFIQEDWKAAALYKNGDYEKSLEYYAKKNDVVSIYNQGNALAKSGKIKDAIAKYEEVLKINPSFEDAQFNLEYLKKQQQNQQQNKNEQQQQKQEQKQEKQEKQNSENSENHQNNEQQEKPEQQEQEQQQNSQGGSESKNNEKESQSVTQDDNKSNSEKSGSNDENSEDQNKSNDNKADKQNNSKDDNQNSNSNINEENEVTSSSNNKQEQGEEESKAIVNVAEGKHNKEEQEEMLAKIHRYRQIEEDKGGLLKAIIKKEYSKNRYGKE